MNYEEWLKSIPSDISGDPLWRMEVYRLALFAAEVGWCDVTKLAQDKRMVGLSDQMFRSLGSIGANIAEGYSRGTGKDQARFYEYALGSAREARHWYYNAKPLLGQNVVNHRLRLTTQMIRLLLTIIPAQRTSDLREDPIFYKTQSEETNADFAVSELNVPFA